MNRETITSRSDNELRDLSNETDNNQAKKSRLFEVTPFIDKANNLNGDVETPTSPTCTENLSFYFSQFCGATSIHGIQYIGERGRFIVEKIIWTIILTVLGSICIHLILKAYNKWVTSPVIVSFSTTETPIWNIPFPAVTICPEVKSDPTKFNFTDVVLKKYLGVEELSDHEKKYLDIFSLICEGSGVVNLDDKGSNFLNESFTEDLDEIYPEMDPLNVTTVKWLGQELTVPNSLTYTITSEGWCVSFNMLDYDEIVTYPDEYLDKSNKDMKATKWSLEGGYPDDKALDSFPRRTFVSGIDGGLIIDALYTNHSDLDYLCQESLQGFKVVLHHPSELPNMDNHFRVPLDQAVTVGIKPRMITVSQNLLSYNSESRKCYFSNERKLELFNSYSQRNCLTECLVNFTIDSCGCVPFYMPEYEDSKYCGPAKEDCVKKSKIYYLLNETSSNNKVCNCLPSCTSLEYDVEITQTAWNWREFFGVFNRIGLQGVFTEFENSHFSRLIVFYKEMQFLTSERNELYGYVDFFSNTGGLLGLFVGFSVTSAIEILYFLTLRLICNIKKYGKKVWSGEAELVEAEDKKK